MSTTRSEKPTNAPSSGSDGGPPAASMCTSPVESKSYLFGAQGKSLIRQVSFAGSLGFFLFGYDQGVLGVSYAKQTAPSLQQNAY